MKLGTETASVSNWMLGGTKGAPQPQVGMGATILMWTDRRPATIIKVTPKSVTVQEDRAIREDKNGMSECQSYRFEPNPNGPVMTYRLRKTGAYKGPLGQLRIGDRAKYHDYSF